jgi:hypothetical protein
MYERKYRYHDQSACQKSDLGQVPSMSGHEHGDRGDHAERCRDSHDDEQSQRR